MATIQDIFISVFIRIVCNRRNQYLFKDSVFPLFLFRRNFSTDVFFDHQAGNGCSRFTSPTTMFNIYSYSYLWIVARGESKKQSGLCLCFGRYRFCHTRLCLAIQLLLRFRLLRLVACHRSRDQSSAGQFSPCF